MNTYNITYTLPNNSGLFYLLKQGEEDEIKKFCEEKLSIKEWITYDFYIDKTYRISGDIDKLQYSYHVFYKTENSYGWNIALLTGKFDEVKERCELKKHNGVLFDYQIYSGGYGISSQDKEIQNYNRPADEIARLSWWVYNTELKKWFMDEDDIIPAPKSSPKEITNDFKINVSVEDEWNDIEDILIDLKSGITIEQQPPTVSFEFITPNQQVISLIDMYDLKEHYEKFINRIKDNKYACFVVQELSQQKFLVWNVEDKVRCVIQDYNHEEVEIKMDVLIDKKVFLNEVEKATERAKIEKQKFIDNIMKELKNKIIKRSS